MFHSRVGLQWFRTIALGRATSMRTNQSESSARVAPNASGPDCNDCSSSSVIRDPFLSSLPLKKAQAFRLGFILGQAELGYGQRFAASSQPAARAGGAAATAV